MATKYSILIKYIKDFQLRGLGSFSDSAHLNMIMRKGKMVPVTPTGSDILATIVAELQKKCSLGKLFSNKQLDKYFADDFFILIPGFLVQ
jgi:hypothetical protein